MLATAGGSTVEVVGSKRWLHDAVEELLERARAAEALRPGLGADDLRLLVYGLEQALRGARSPPPQIVVDRYVAVLLDGLRSPGCRV